jgi:hypothetical protein
MQQLCVDMSYTALCPHIHSTGAAPRKSASNLLCLSLADFLRTSPPGPPSPPPHVLANFLFLMSTPSTRPGFAKPPPSVNATSPSKSPCNDQQPVGLLLSPVPTWPSPWRCPGCWDVLQNHTSGGPTPSLLGFSPCVNSAIPISILTLVRLAYPSHVVAG